MVKSKINFNKVIRPVVAAQCGCVINFTFFLRGSCTNLTRVSSVVRFDFFSGLSPYRKSKVFVDYSRTTQKNRSHVERAYGNSDYRNRQTSPVRFRNI